MSKMSSHFFYNMLQDAVMRYVMWDTRHNVWVYIGSMLMAQGDKGVPIGGFFRAHEMIPWAISKGRNVFKHDTFL